MTEVLRLRAIESVLSDGLGGPETDTARTSDSDTARLSDYLASGDEFVFSLNSGTRDGWTLGDGLTTGGTGTWSGWSGGTWSGGGGTTGTDTGTDTTTDTTGTDTTTDTTTTTTASWSGGSWSGGGWTGGNGGSWVPGVGWVPAEPVEVPYIPQDPMIITIMVDGVERSFGIILPEDFDPNETYSAIMTFHGGGGILTDPAEMAALTGYSGYDNPPQFIEIYPIALDDKWGWDPMKSPTDDIAYVEAVVEEVVANYNVNPDQLYAAGISGGGMMVQSLALEVPELFSGYAVVVANMMEVLQMEAVAAVSQEPIIIFHGTEDPSQPYDGIPGWKDKMVMYGSMESAEFWAEYNGTTMGEYVALPDTVDDGMTVMMSTSLDGTVEHYVVVGGGHTWPGSADPEAAQDIDASQLIVDFFSDYGF